ncbi:unnamed protein product [Rotaria sordida]|uniref:Uncharacterized protein n=1 Tax=Rotaria sordida TaxID=392033 RepID=A0A814PET4_9BILA|nr:unnamed protein product [Rotaria sordida]
MDIHWYNVGIEEECVLFECKGRFQGNYQRYVTYILNNRHIPRQVAKIYRKISFTQAIERINKFFTHRTKQYEQDILQDDYHCLSPQRLMAYDERSSLNDFKEKEFVTEDLPDQLHETKKGESDILSTEDIQNESKCLITILSSGIFPRCELISELSKNSFTQPELQSVCTSDQDSEFSSYHIAQQTTTMTIPNALKNDSFGSTDRQVPPTPPTDQSDDPLLSPISLNLPRKQRYQRRLYRPRIVRRLACGLQKNDSFGSTDRQVPPTPPTDQSDDPLLSPISLNLPHKPRYQRHLYRPRIVRRLACGLQKINAAMVER